MRRHALVVLAVFALSQSAYGGNLPVKALDAPAPYDWTGYYAGANLDYQAGQSRWSEGPAAARGAGGFRIRAAKTDLLTTLSMGADRPGGEDAREQDGRSSTHRTIESQISEWLNQHPAPSRPGYCAWCGRSGSPSTVVLPFGTEPETHTWLHSDCWPDWHRARMAEAAKALALKPVGRPRF
jgi:hypothetical protein